MLPNISAGESYCKVVNMDLKGQTLFKYVTQMGQKYAYNISKTCVHLKLFQENRNYEKNKKELAGVEISEI